MTEARLAVAYLYRQHYTSPGAMSARNEGWTGTAVTHGDGE